LTAVEAGPAAPCVQERLLDRVFGLVEGGEHPVAVDVQLTPVPFGQSGERGLVTCDRRLQRPQCSRSGRCSRATSVRQISRSPILTV
jgi:hypothetical protein